MHQEITIQVEKIIDRINYAKTDLHPRWNDSGDATIFGTDRFGFGVLPSGFRQYIYSFFGGIGDVSLLFCNNLNIDSNPFSIEIDVSDKHFYLEYQLKNYGFSVRASRTATSEEQLLPDGLIDATYTDYDGNVYQCTKIGTQVWTTTNLKVTKYVDGITIPTNLSDSAWAADTDGACAVYGKNDGAFIPTDELTTEELMVAAYGRLYNWYAVNNVHGLIDPTDGWHVPTDAEFTTLTDYLCTIPGITSDNVGDVLKSTRQVNSPYIIPNNPIIIDDLSFPYDFPIELNYRKVADVDRYLAVVDEYLDLDDNVKIVRDYTSPWFSDPTKLTNGGTKSCKFPWTERNKAISKNMQRADMNTNFPYRIQSSNNYVNGLEIWRNAEVKTLGDLEFQFTYGINRAKYVPLFTKKLNEIVPNGTTILESDWVVNWTKGNGTSTGMFTRGKKYKYIDYVSAQEDTTSEVISGVVQPKEAAPEPYLSNQKQMTLHPFVEYSDILDLISADQNIETFDLLKSRLLSLGLILGGAKGSIEKTITKIPYSTTTSPYDSIILNNNSIPFDDLVMDFFGEYFFIHSFTIGIPMPFTVNIDINLKITLNSGGIRLVRKYKLNGSGAYLYDYTAISPTSITGTQYIYSGVLVNLEIPDVTDSYYFEPINHVNYTISDQSIDFSYKCNSALYGSLTDSLGYYDCLLNLPDMTQMEFIQQMCIMTGLSIGYNSDGDFKFYSLDDIKSNMLAGNFYDWTNRISSVKKSLFQFNSNAKTNWIKYNNSDSIKSYTNKDSLIVDDDTITAERDLFNIKFDLAEKSADGKLEFILYKQKVTKTDTGKTFDIQFNEKPSVSVVDIFGTAYNEPILPNDLGNYIDAYVQGDTPTIYGKLTMLHYNEGIKHLKVGDQTTKINGVTHVSNITSIDYDLGIIQTDYSGYVSNANFNINYQGFISKYYPIYQKLINQPKVKDVEINLEFFESANIKPDYPIWIGEWGVWALYLGHTAPDRDVSLVTLLIINEQL